MEALRAATDEEVSKMPSWIYTFWQSMLKEGRKEATAKQYARTLLLLFEEDRKAPHEMASQVYFDITKASPKNKSGNGQRAASVNAFKKFYEQIEGDASKLEEPDEEATFCQVGNTRKPRAAPKALAHANGSFEPKEKPKASAGTKQPKEVKNGRKTKQTHEQEKAKVDKPRPDDLERATVSLSRAFELLAQNGRTQSSSSPRPRALHVYGRDLKKRMAQRIHGVYVELEEEIGGRPVFEKVDYEKRTYILFNQEKNTWRMSVSMEGQGDFAKVKEPVDLPWLVTKPWRVYSDGGSYEEDPDLKCDFLDPEMPLPDAEVEVCFQMPSQEAGQLATGTSSSSKRKATPEPAPVEPDDRRALQISGLDDSFKNAGRIMGFYFEAAQHNGRPSFAKNDTAKPSILFFHADKDKWRIAKSLTDKGDFAYVKDKAEFPWQVTKPWKVFDGEDRKEVMLQMEEADRSVVQVPQRGTTAKRRREDMPQMDMDKLNLDVLSCLPEDAPPGHAAHDAVKWEAPSRAFFYFNGARFQVSKAGSGSEAAALVIARACHVKLSEGFSRDEVLTFRDLIYQKVRDNLGNLEVSCQDDDPGDDELPKKLQKKARKDKANRANRTARSASESSLSSSSDSESSDEDADLQGVTGYGRLVANPPPGRMNRACAKMSVLTGLRCYQCYQERKRCRCEA